MDKRSQITVFIIIGLVLLIAVAVGYFSVKYFFKSQSPEQKKVTADFPLKTNVEYCMVKLAEEAFVNLGSHSGFINPETNEYQPFKFVINKNTPTEGDGVYFSGLFLPYFWSVKGPSNCKKCIVVSYFPGKRFIEKEVASYINKNIDDCISWQEFNKTYNIQRSYPNTTVRILDKYVEIYLNYPMKVSMQKKEMTADYFIKEIDFDFAGIYSAAESLFYAEAEKSFLENTIMALISVYSAIDPERLPPIGGITDDKTVITWKKEKVKMMLGEILQSNIPLLTFTNTTNFVDYSARLPEYKIFIVNISNPNITFPNLKYEMSAVFPIQPKEIYFNIHPSDGETIRPNSYTQDIGFPFNLLIYHNVYRFLYDVSFPVVFVIRDPNAFNGKGYTFMFSMESFVKGNRNIKDWHQGNGTVTFNPYIYNNIQVEGEEITFLPSQDYCAKEQMISKNIVLNIYDYLTGEPLPEASIYFACGGYAKCFLGTTNTEGKFESRFPICLNGMIKIRKEDYATKSYVISTSDVLENMTFDLYVYPYRIINISSKIKQLTRLAGNISNTSEMGNNDLIQVNIQSVEDETESGIALILGNTTNSTIRIAPGDYKVEAIYIDNKGIVIPKECMHVCSDCYGKDADEVCYGKKGVPWPTHCATDKWIPENETIIKPAVVGGFYLNDESRFWHVNDSIYNYTLIEFQALRIANATCFDDSMESIKYWKNYIERQRDCTLCPQGDCSLCFNGYPYIWPDDKNVGYDEIDNIVNYSIKWRADIEPVLK